MTNKVKLIVHAEGPFAGVRAGDTLRVFYHGAPAALFTVRQVKRHSLIGADGIYPCRMTLVSSTEMRFYAYIAENRESVLRGVTFLKQA